MGVRVLLVAVVACLGLDLPSGSDLSRWSRAGREWAGGRLNELADLRDRAEHALMAEVDAPTPPSEVAPAPDPSRLSADLIFEAVNDGDAQALAADLVAIRGQDRPAEPVPAAEVVAIEADSGVEAVPAEDTPAPAIEVSAASPRLDRLASALSLTRQAAKAWASLAQAAGEEPEASR